MITTTPVSLGVLFRHFKSAIAIRIETGLERLAYVLWTIIVIGAVVSAYDKVMSDFAHVDGAVVLTDCNDVFWADRRSNGSNLTRTESKTLAIEASIQNSPMALTLAVLISGATTALPDLAIPAAVYSLTMYAVAFPSVILLRRWGDSSDPNQTPAFELIANDQ